MAEAGAKYNQDPDSMRNRAVPGLTGGRLLDVLRNHCVGPASCMRIGVMRRCLGHGRLGMRFSWR